MLLTFGLFDFIPHQKKLLGDASLTICVTSYGANSHHHTKEITIFDRINPLVTPEFGLNRVKASSPHAPQLRLWSPVHWGALVKRTHPHVPAAGWQCPCVRLAGCHAVGWFHPPGYLAQEQGGDAAEPPHMRRCRGCMLHARASSQRDLPGQKGWTNGSYKAGNA